jgi:hypothetical protein
VQTNAKQWSECGEYANLAVGRYRATAIVLPGIIPVGAAHSPEPELDPFGLQWNDRA